MAWSDAERRELERLCEDFPYYAGACLQLADKQGRLQPFVFNRAQQILHAQLEEQRIALGMVRAIIVKGRQQGISTYVGGRFYHRVTTGQGTRAKVIAHQQDSTDMLFSMVKRYHEHNPMAPATGESNAKALAFPGLDGNYGVATAGSRDVGRGGTAQLLHGSEFAYWKTAQQHLAGIGNIVADLPGTEIIIESTGNGMGNAFHELWQAAEAGTVDYRPIFLEWWLQPEYRSEVPKLFELSDRDEKYMRAYRLTIEQMAWRAKKIASYGKGFAWLFDQEYPATPTHAFQSPTADPLISPEDVTEAVESGYTYRSGALVLGCDPAESGKDRTAIAWRQGRIVPRVEAYEHKSPMEVAGILAGYWRDGLRGQLPEAMFVDRIGLGAGIVDRLRELNIPVIAFNSSETADDDTTYHNKRAEVWWRMKDWFEDKPCRIPNDSALRSDIAAPGYKTSSNGRRLLESKDSMKQRSVRSPDLGDALAFTFAQHVAPGTRSLQEERMYEGAYAGRPATKAGY